MQSRTTKEWCGFLYSPHSRAWLCAGEMVTSQPETKTIRSLMKQFSTSSRVSTRRGLLAVSPLLLMVVFFLAMSLVTGSFYKVPLVIVFIIASAYALFITNHPDATRPAESELHRGLLPIAERVSVFSRGAGEKNLMMMLWIFILAGAFAASAKQMGAIDSTVAMTLRALPVSLLVPGLFLAACFVSLSIGTSVGTVMALVPVATGVASSSGLALPLVVGAVVGGAFFGDNLSFISDTTIVATRSQGVRLSDKFRTNIRIALPAAVICFALYCVLGHGGHNVASIPDFSLLKVVPYLAVLVAAVLGVDVMLVLLLGNVLTGAIGLATGSFDVAGWFASMAKGVSGMNETILIALLAGGLMEVIRHNGGIDFLISRLTRHIRGKRGAEAAISALVVLTNCVTANNTVAILSVGRISSDIADRYGVNKCKSASLLDTFSCVAQGLLPYGAQLLLASSLAALSPLQIIPYLYYNFLLGVVAIGGILLRYPRKYS